MKQRGKQSARNKTDQQRFAAGCACATTGILMDQMDHVDPMDNRLYP